MKKLFTFVFAMLLIGNVKAASWNDIKTARESGSDLKTYNGVHIGESIPKDYSFALGGGTRVKSVIGGNENTKITDEVASSWNTTVSTHPNATFVEEEIKGKYYVLYKAVDVYDNHLIDVKLTVMDFETPSVPHARPMISFLKSMIGIDVWGVQWIKIKYEFIDSKTGALVKVKGNTTYKDVDVYQGVITDSSNKGLYVSSSDNILKTTNVDGGIYVYDDSGINEHTNSFNYAFTEIFEGSSMERIYTFGHEGKRRTEWHTGSIYNIASPIVVNTLPNIIKYVSKEEVKPGDKITYTLKQQVYEQITDNYFKSFKIEDIFEDVFEIDSENIKVKNIDEDVTGNFDISVINNKMVVSAKNVGDATFYGKTYIIEVPVTLKDTDLSKYKKSDNYVIPNEAKSTYIIASGEEKNSSSKVEVKYIPEKKEEPKEPLVVKVPPTLATASAILSIVGIGAVVGSGITIYKYIKKEK